MWRSETPSARDRFLQCCGNQVGWSWSTLRFSCDHHLHSPVGTLICGTAWRVCVFCFNVLMIRTQAVRLAGQMLSLTKPSTQLLICLVHSCKVNFQNSLMAQRVEPIARWHDWQPKFDFLNLHKSRRRKLTPQSCPVISIFAPWYSYTQTYTSYSHPPQ